MKKFALPLYLLLSAFPVMAQFSLGVPSAVTSYRGQGDAQGNRWGTIEVELRTPVPPALIGAPFSGKEERKSEQLLFDGGRITVPVGGPQLARDAQGRTRVERSLTPGMSEIPGRPPAIPPMIVEINDVVAGYYYVLDPAKKIAYRFKYTPVPPRTVSQTRPPPAVLQTNVQLIPGGAPQATLEPLGTKVIQGVETEGQRRTIVMPAGFRGNDRPMTDVNEMWTAPSLQLVLRQTSRTSTGSSSSEIVNLSTSNPALELFQPPPGYEVIDKTGYFTAEFGDRPSGGTGPGTQR